MLLLRATEQIGGFAEPIGGAASFRIALLARTGAAHIVIRLLQTIEGLLHRGSDEFCPDWPDCPDWPLPDWPDWPGLPRLPCSNLAGRLLAVLIILGQLFHLFLQLLGVAAEHLLLPAFL